MVSPKSEVGGVGRLVRFMPFLVHLNCLPKITKPNLFKKVSQQNKYKINK